MAYIFNDINHFKEFVGGAVNVSLELDSIAPTIRQAAVRHITPWLSEAQWNALVDNFATPTAEQTALLPYVQRPLAMLTMFEYAKIGGLQFSEAGIYRSETEQMKTPYKYQENEYKTYMLHHGYDAIEEMLDFLESNEADYPDWVNSTAYSKNKELFINSSAELRDVYARYIDRHTFDTIRPMIYDVEQFAILPLLGEDQFDDLKAAVLAKNTTAIQDQLIALIRRAVGHFSVEEAIRRLWVQVQGDRVISAETLEPQGYRKEGIPSGQQINLTLMQQDEFANRYVSRIKQFLSDNEDSFPLYAAYIKAQAAAEAAEAESTECTDATGFDYDKRCRNPYLYPGADEPATDTPEKGTGFVSL